LSTFSSHIRTIKSILDLSDQNSLVLLDEIGSATDPEEGAALAQSTLRTLARRGCLTLATTHMGALKLYAHGTDGVENASLTFDNKTLQPTYRFQMGIPGASYAFEIAQRFGLPENLVSEARTLVGHERGRMDHLLMDLERESRRVHETLSNVEIEQSRLAGLIALYQDKIAKAKEEGEKIKQTRLEEAESILQKTNRLAENLIRELRETKGDPSKIREHRSLLAEHRKLIQLHRGKPNEKGEAIFHPGDWILWDGHGGKARVLSEADGKGRLWVQWNDVRLQVSGSECRLLEKSETSVSPRTHVECDSGGSVRDEVDLRGMTVDESLPVLEKYLSDASMAGLSLVRIIHGKGTGVLRKEVGNYLKRHALVKSQRLGHWNEGDTGVTIVELL
ncbi:MAG TPA: Smr/MutS family protein, partial [bacterium]